MNMQNDQPQQNNERQDKKEMRLWELGGKGDILSGWYDIIIKGILPPVIIIILVIYLFWTKQFETYFPTIGLKNGLLIAGLILLGSLYRIGRGIWEIFLGKSKLLRKRWTWYFSVITLPLGMIGYLVSYLRLPEKDLGHTIGLFSIILAFGAIYYYLWTIKGKFSDEAVAPIKDDLQELSQWPLAKDRPLGFFILGTMVLVASVFAFGSAAIGFSNFDNMNLGYSIIGFSLSIAIFITGIGLTRMKKYGFIGAICATILLGVMTLLSKDTGINIYLYALIGFILIDFYLFFEKEKLN